MRESQKRPRKRNLFNINKNKHKHILNIEYYIFLQGAGADMQTAEQRDRKYRQNKETLQKRQN